MINTMKDTMKEVDTLEVTTLMDNYVDVLLRNSPGVRRPPLAIGGDIPADALLAEHGLSLLLTVKKGDASHTILFDCGYTNIGVPHNMDLLGINPKDIEAIVLSHGHMDHTGSLYPVMAAVGRQIPLIVHPDAFVSPRFFGLDDGRKIKFPQTLKKEEMLAAGINIIENKLPYLLAEDMILITGEVERVTSFEKGLPNATYEKDGKSLFDPILDDQAIAVHVKGKGLVVVSGCAHAGIVNTIMYAKKVTGVEKVYGVLGGFHLSGPIFEPIIEETIREFKKMDPQLITPMHCTGWNAIKRFSEEFPSSFALNSVGTKVTFG
jgi:7,8-dihydropterin-6-yl-methyl-4-(beta-D-ribofuranosyl)aminobenzene 5'-phosphate synthase